MHNAKISAVVITLNEEQNIRWCLESVKWCDEIIVVDMYSNDKTVEIAKEYTDIILFYDRVQAFDRAKGFGVEKASSDWILILDADEVIPPVLARHLRTMSLDITTDVVMMPRKNYLFGEWVNHSDCWPDYQMRLFRKGRVRMSERIHHYIEIDPSSRFIRLPANEECALNHFSYLDIEHFINKANHYTGVEAKQCDCIRYSLFALFYYPLREFFRRYFKHLGFLDGVHGLVVCVLYSIYQLLFYMKRLEIENQFTKVEVIKKYTEIRKQLLS